MAKPTPKLSAIPAQTLSSFALLVPIVESCKGSHAAQMLNASYGLNFLASILTDHATHSDRIITLNNDELEGIGCAIKAIARGLILEANDVSEASAEALAHFHANEGGAQ